MNLIVLAKQPVAGHVKTRLCPPCTAHEAAALAAAALEDTLAAVAAVRGVRRVLVLDGVPGGWLPAGFDVVRQRGASLDQRLAAAFEDCGAPAVLVGMDTPQLSVELLLEATSALDDCDAVLGPAVDGGYWAVGLRQPDRRAFAGVPMSTAWTAAAQRRRFAELGLRVAELPCLRDVDSWDDAIAVASEAPTTRFARRVGSPT